MSNPKASVPDAVAGNIDVMLDVEQTAVSSGSPLARFSHAFGDTVGSIAFAVVHLTGFVAWLVLNSGVWPRVAFDPYPFPLLGTLVSFEAVLLSTFVLIKQNRESQRAERRAHLDLQVNLLTEREVTKVLQIVQRLADKTGPAEPHDPELTEMLEHTAIKALAKHLDDRFDAREDRAPP